MTKIYLYEMGDHIYETQAKAKALWSESCYPGMHDWVEPTLGIAICSTCGMIRRRKKV